MISKRFHHVRGVCVRTSHWEGSLFKNGLHSLKWVYALKHLHSKKNRPTQTHSHTNESERWNNNKQKRCEFWALIFFVADRHANVSAFSSLTNCKTHAEKWLCCDVIQFQRVFLCWHCVTWPPHWMGHFQLRFFFASAIHTPAPLLYSVVIRLQFAFKYGTRNSREREREKKNGALKPSNVFCQRSPKIRALLLTCGCNLDIDRLDIAQPEMLKCCHAPANRFCGFGLATI